MHLKEALERHLKATSVIKALINEVVYFGNAPEKSPFKFVTYDRYAPNQYSHVLGADSGYLDGYYQISIYSKSATDTQAIADVIRKSLMNFSGELGGYTSGQNHINGVTIQAAEIEGEQDFNTGNLKEFCVIQEYKFTYIEEVT